MIRKLDPFPGRRFNSEQTMFIKPELLTKKIENEFVTVFIDDELTDIKLSPSYLDLCKDKEQRKVRFIKDSQRSAEWLIRCIEQRKKTIHKIADYIVKYQSEFIEKGPQFLKPLGLKDVSNAVGLHESTISRAINGKLIATPRGIIELREFFSNAVSNNKNDTLNDNFETNLETCNDSNSSDSITEVIKLMIMNEDSHEPLSDEKLKDLLKDRGIKIARRTVAKYREDLKIPSSSERKRIKLFSERTGT